VAQQRQRAVGDQVDGRLVAGHQQQHAHRQQLPLAELAALVLGGDQRREQVTGRMGAALGDQLTQVAVQRQPRLQRPLQRVGGHQRVQQVDQRPRPGPEPVPVGLRHAEQLADHRDGQGVGEVLGHVHRARAGDPFQQFRHDHLDPRSQPLHRPRRERLADQRSQPRVVGRVDEQHRGGGLLPGQQPVHLGGQAKLPHPLGAAQVPAHPRVPQHRQHVSMAGEHPESQRAAVHRVGGAELLVQRIGVLVDLGQEGVERQRLARGHGQPPPPVRRAPPPGTWGDQALTP
jgi:hypothetical protein